MLKRSAGRAAFKLLSHLEAGGKIPAEVHLAVRKPGGSPPEYAIGPIVAV
jgi:hypothetical protein